MFALAVVRLRHSPDLTGVTWATSTSISDDVAGSATETYEDLKPGTYSIKFVDSGGRESLDAAYIEFTKADLDNVENVSSQTEDPSFAGTKTNLVVDTAQNELELDFEPGVETASVGDMLAENDTLILMEDDTDNTSVLGLEGNKGFFTSGTYEFKQSDHVLRRVQRQAGQHVACSCVLPLRHPLG